MSATDELRRLLDERRVEYCADDVKTVWATRWDFDKHGSAMFTEYDDGVCVFVTSNHTWTPEQAVEATLGRGECKNVARVECYFSPGDFKCSECGCMVASDSEYEPLVYFTPDDFGDEIGWRFCPSCGRKVV